MKIKAPSSTIETTESEAKFFREFASWAPRKKYEYVQQCTTEQAFRLKYEWRAWARDSQLPPSGDWSIWVMMGGRGMGKTRSGAEWINGKAARYPGVHMALVGRTVADVRDVMIQGRSGILLVAPPWFRPEYSSSKRQIMWPNGSHATTYSADSPDQLRGPQHSFAWGDERAAWKYDDAWDQLMFGLRIPPVADEIPQCLVTTTPRSTKAMKDLIKDPQTVVTRGTTYDNIDNLSPTFLREIERKYGGTTLGRQEIEGALIEDVEGALWNRVLLDSSRVMKAPELVRIVIGVDPAVTNTETSDETGIVVAGEGVDHHAYVLADYTLKGTPLEWAQAVVTAYHLFKADRVIGEVNNGGDLIEQNIRTVDPNISYKSVHATRGKQIRAEPIVSLYEQNRAHHVGNLPALEDEQCTWEPGVGKSPNRVDACVWSLTELNLNGGDIPVVISSGYIPDALPTFYTSEDADENERLERQQQRIAGVLQSLNGGKWGW